jgi:lysophospholipase L1-like esterase
VSGQAGPRRLGAAVLVLGSVCVGIAVIEGIARIAELAPRIERIRARDRASALRLSENPILGYEFRESFVGPDGFRTNALGQRDVERSVEKAPGIRRIIVLGDSVVMGLHLALGQTITQQLEALLADRRVEALNFGVQGYCTQAEVELLRIRGLRLSPDLVVVVFLRNDHRNFNGDIVRNLERPRPAWAEQLFVRSHLFRFVSLRLDLFHLRSELDPDYDRRWNEAAVDDDNVESGLATLARLSRERGFGTLVAVWPSFARDGTLDPAGLFEDEAQRRMKVESIAARHSIPTARLSERFRADYASRVARGEVRGGRPSPRDLYADDGMHPNAFGAETAARIVLALIEERGLLPAQ